MAGDDVAVERRVHQAVLQIDGHADAHGAVVAERCEEVAGSRGNMPSFLPLESERGGAISMAMTTRPDGANDFTMARSNKKRFGSKLTSSCASSYTMHVSSKGLV